MRQKEETFLGGLCKEYIGTFKDWQGWCAAMCTVYSIIPRCRITYVLCAVEQLVRSDIFRLKLRLMMVTDEEEEEEGGDDDDGDGDGDDVCCMAVERGS